jgi:hypothetical protein
MNEADWSRSAETQSRLTASLAGDEHPSHRHDGRHQRQEHKHVHRAKAGLAFVVQGGQRGANPSTFAGIEFESCTFHNWIGSIYRTMRPSGDILARRSADFSLVRSNVVWTKG